MWERHVGKVWEVGLTVMNKKINKAVVSSMTSPSVLPPGESLWLYLLLSTLIMGKHDVIHKTGGA